MAYPGYPPPGGPGYGAPPGGAVRATCRTLDEEELGAEGGAGLEHSSVPLGAT